MLPIRAIVRLSPAAGTAPRASIPGWVTAFSVEVELKLKLSQMVIPSQLAHSIRPVHICIQPNICGGSWAKAVPTIAVVWFKDFAINEP